MIVKPQSGEFVVVCLATSKPLSRINDALNIAKRRRRADP